jgi:hypothetical protein
MLKLFEVFPLRSPPMPTALNIFSVPGTKQMNGPTQRSDPFALHKLPELSPLSNRAIADCL